jgi:hypothetical protein
MYIERRSWSWNGKKYRKNSQIQMKAHSKKKGRQLTEKVNGESWRRYERGG